MGRNTLRRIHLTASTVATVLVMAFAVSSVVAEVVGDAATIEAVKRGIAVGLVALVPSVVGAGVSGQLLGGRGRGAFVRRKRRRMVVIGTVGVCVLAPCAITLDRMASHGVFDAWFMAIQGLEYIGGTVNLLMLGLNFRDGWAVRRRRVRALSRTPGEEG